MTSRCSTTLQRLVRATQGVAVALVLLSGTAGCGNAQTLVTQPAAPDGPVVPKVNRLVFATPPPVNEGNSPGRDLGPPDIIQLRPLYEYLAAISPETGKYVPGLATAWKLEPDGRGYRYNLRKGVQFHRNYGEMTAKDVAFSLWDVQQPDSRNSHSGDWRELVPLVEQVNDYEVVFHLTRPDASFFGDTSQQLAGLEIHSKAEFDAIGHPPSLQEKASAGTGAYEFMERTPGAFIRFKRVAFQHWRANPDFPELEIRWVKEASTRLASLLVGEVQLTTLPQDLKQQARGQKMQVARGTIPGVRFFLQMHCCYLNDVKDPSKGYKYPNSPLMDLRVRKALSKAINRNELNKTLFGGDEELLVLNHYHPKFRRGWNPAWETRFPEEYGFDLAKAKALIADAGYGPSRPIKLTMILTTLAEVPQSQDVQEAVANYWRAAGVEVALISPDRGEVSRKTPALEYDAHISPFAAPSDQLNGAYIFNTYSLKSRGSVVELPEVDGLFQTLRRELDESKQEDWFRKLGDLMYDGHQHIPLFWVPVEVAYNPQVISSYVFPGSISGLYTHLETVKATR